MEGNFMLLRSTGSSGQPSVSPRCFLETQVKEWTKKVFDSSRRGSILDQIFADVISKVYNSVRDNFSGSDNKMVFCFSHITHIPQNFPTAMQFVNML